MNSHDGSLAQRLLASLFTPPPRLNAIILVLAHELTPSFFYAWWNATCPCCLRLCFLFTVAFCFRWLALLQRESPLLHASLWLSCGSCIIPKALSFSASSASVHTSSIPTRVVGASSLDLIRRASQYAISHCSSLGDRSRDLSRDLERGSSTSSTTKVASPSSSPLQPHTSQAQGWTIKLHLMKEWLCSVLCSKSPTFIR
jgi:hypothetical protein